MTNANPVIRRNPRIQASSLSCTETSWQSMHLLLDIKGNAGYPPRPSGCCRPRIKHRNRGFVGTQDRLGTYERTVSADNCVRSEKLILQIPADRHRCHYVKARVRVNRYANGALAIFHGPRGLAYFTQDGKPITEELQLAA